jgi:4-hydroxy-3-methylbut-2-enyl diphosphate reductase
MAEQVSKLYGTFYITEDIIHNRIFMSGMVKHGVVKVASLDEVPNGGVVMFSAHGVPPHLVAKAEEMGLTIIDGTCPVVKAIQCEIAKEVCFGKKIIIIGDRAHAEVIAFIGVANGSSDVFVVSSEADVELLPSFDGEGVSYFTQTTFDYAKLQLIIKKLYEKVPHLKSGSPDNVCHATRERQEVVRKIAASVDLVIVIGSAHSSNAKRLHEVAISSGAKNAILIDSKNEFDSCVLDGVDTIAVTSSASTMEVVVQEFTEYIATTFGAVIEDFSFSGDKSEDDNNE